MYVCVNGKVRVCVCSLIYFNCQYINQFFKFFIHMTTWVYWRLISSIHHIMCSRVDKQTVGLHCTYACQQTIDICFKLITHNLYAKFNNVHSSFASDHNYDFYNFVYMRLYIFWSKNLIDTKFWDLLYEGVDCLLINFHIILIDQLLFIHRFRLSQLYPCAIYKMIDIISHLRFDNETHKVYISNKFTRNYF